jgi:hypothetical protein
MKLINKCIAQFLIVCTVGLGVPLPASAGIVATDQIQSSAERDRVKSFLGRADVRSQMMALGVDSNLAMSRIDAMTDEEVQELAGRVDQMPAGGADVLGVLLFIFIVLLVTDILGLTKVFPFTRSIK